MQCDDLEIKVSLENLFGEILSDFSSGLAICLG